MEVVYVIETGKSAQTPSQSEVTRFVSQIPTRYRGLVERALAGEAFRPQAVKAKCLDCSCYQIDEVRHCQVWRCPLWRYRPYQLGDEPDDDASTSAAHAEETA